MERKMKITFSLLGIALLGVIIWAASSFVSSMNAETAANQAIAAKITFELQQKQAQNEQEAEKLHMAEANYKDKVYAQEQRQAKIDSAVSAFRKAVADADANWLAQRDIWNKCPKSMMEDNGVCYDR
jgi:ABC-type Na+ efflux pump permease subunit